ncbi:MAG: response regulator transcription factor [Bacteroidetes bacterium]|nr:response regulator transcription factor [Bacteroidota bacterium]
MTIIIIEDELPAAERLSAMVREFDPAVRIAAVLRSVKEARAWFSSHPAPDCILADIQLTDGLSLDIFRSVPVTAPVIFITAFDEYLMKAFAFNSIDYLLKPLDKAKLFRALGKYLTLREHFAGNLAAMSDQWERKLPVTDRLVVKKGTEYIVLRTDQIAYFYSEHKITFLRDTAGVRYIVDKPLAELEQSYTRPAFFRVNRKYLAASAAVRRFRPLDKGKLLVDLDPSAGDDVIVSQENASAFKQWMGR